MLEIVCAMLQIAHQLLGKILIDLRNTKEETMSVAELKQNQEIDDAAVTLPSLVKSSSGKHVPKMGSSRQSSTENVTDKDTEKETQYRLDPKYHSKTHELGSPIRVL
jgi:inositol hexakisphosphate/diphosphoinositol-pentakisphosphate kinase